jgi:hypothetical protein
MKCHNFALTKYAVYSFTIENIYLKNYLNIVHRSGYVLVWHP